MNHNKQTVSKIIRLLLLSLTTLWLVSATVGSVRAQESETITKEKLLHSIKRERVRQEKEKVDAEWYVEMINQHGVDFRMTDEYEREIRQAGSYLGTEGLNDLIKAVHNNYYKERLKVSLFEYARCNEKFEDFVAVIESKLNLLPSTFSSRGDYSYIKRLNLRKEKKPFNSREEADQYWKKTRSLQLLKGMCSSRGNDLYVLSQVFLGELNGSLVTPVRIEFKIQDDEFSKTKDIHSLLILYSLAQEAQARGLRKDLIIGYLSEALGIAAQIENPNPQTVQPIKSAIERMLRELGASNLMVLPAQ